MSRKPRRFVSSPPRGPVRPRARGRIAPWGALVSLAALALWIATGVTVAEEVAAQQAQRGGRLYRIHCLNCHGEGGRGDGPMAEVLATEVPDLTRLTESHGGTFPRDQVLASIDGRYEVRGHGLREMPVWGLSFEERGRDTSRETEIQQRLRDLTAYLESLQRPPDKR